MASINTPVQIIGDTYTRYISKENVRAFEVLIIRLAIIFFIGHLALIWLFNTLPWLYTGHTFNYLKAIFTPFSFILVYEVFLLVIILPQSMTEFVGKQFEIITLITLRSFFHDIADVPMHQSLNLRDPAVIGLGFDLLAAFLMFTLTVLFHRLHIRHDHHEKKGSEDSFKQFLDLKRCVSMCLLVVLAITSIHNISSWLMHISDALSDKGPFPDPNAFFYLDFFNTMIYADVLLLIISFLYDSSFYTVVRNASFIITTVLLRLSLSMERPTNHIIIIIAFIFSLAVLWILQFRSTKREFETIP